MKADRATLSLSKAAGNLLVLTHIYTATLVLGFGALFGVLQGFARASMIVLPPWLDYYRMLTAHGVLMALVFTTFFIVGLMTYATYESIPRIRSTRVGWIGYVCMLVGTLMAALTILSGNATVMYTFYAPMKASPFFYIGATLLVAGTWFTAFEVFRDIAWFKRNNPSALTPLPAFLAATTLAMWVIATIGIVAEMGLLIPWSLGWTSGIDVGLTRMLFWYFGHPLVYFWIMGAYLIWYLVIPGLVHGRIFSNALTRLSFILFLVLSTPVGLHHQFLEPGINAGWKWMHAFATYCVVIPSFMTAFAMFATFELAARRAGIRGFWKTIGWLPWGDPSFAGAAFGMLLFLFGGFGGIVNSSYSLDILVHNTMWIVGHFHITVGGPVALTFIAATYRLVPTISGRKLFAPKLALVQVYLYFIGMFIMSTGMHIGGLLGAPRRTADVSYGASSVAAAWHPEMVAAAVGGSIVALSILFFIIVATGTYFRTPTGEQQPAFFFSEEEPNAAPVPPLFDNLKLWSAVALALAILAYIGPIWQHFNKHIYLAPGMRTW